MKCNDSGIEDPKTEGGICIQAIYRLPPNLVDMATTLDIGVYLQSYFICSFLPQPFTSNTTVKAFCTYFMATLRNISGLRKHTTVRKLLFIYTFILFYK